MTSANYGGGNGNAPFQYKKRVVNSTTGSPTGLVLTVGDSGTTYTNTGALAQAYFSLPAASLGLWYKFVVTDAIGSGIRVLTTGGAFMFAPSTESVAYVESTERGGVNIIECVDGVNWWNFYQGTWLFG